ncbi:MAG: tetratricopeptide repeat protein, partial [Planctomycetota bacterium]
NVAGHLEKATPSGEVYFTEGVHLAMNRSEVASERVAVRKLEGVPEEVGIYRAVPGVAAAGEASGRKEDADLPFGGMHRMSSGSGNPVARVLQRAVVDGTYASRRLRQRFVDFVATALRVRAVRYVAAGAVLLAACSILLLFKACGCLSAPLLAAAEPHIADGNWTTVAAIADDALRKNPRNPEALLLKGHVASAREEWKHAVDAYRRALEIDDRLQVESRMIANAVRILDVMDAPAIDFIELYPSGAMIDALRARTSRPGYHGRARALTILRRQGKDSGLDEGMIAIHDANEAPGSELRVAAVRKLGEMRDKRAIPVLKKIAAASGVRRFLTKGLVAEAEKALRRIEGTAP